MTSCNEVNRKTSFVNTAMAYTYYDVGKYIIEGEQQGETRAAYGKAVLKNLSVRLSGKYGKGWSVATLKNTKKFYSVYSEMTNSVCPIESKKAKHCLANSKHEAGNLNTSNPQLSPSTSFLRVHVHLLLNLQIIRTEIPTSAHSIPLPHNAT